MAWDTVVRTPNDPPERTDGWEPPYPDYLQVDHKKPRSLGGVDDMENLTLLCDPCNRFKSNKLTLTELQAVRVEEGRMQSDWWKEERWR